MMTSRNLWAIIHSGKFSTPLPPQKMCPYAHGDNIKTDGHDGLIERLVSTLQNKPVIRRRQQGGGIIMWAGTFCDKRIGPYKVNDGVKLTSQRYCEYLNETFF